ncbi:LuxR family transcriptional regulator [Streptomyces sp. CoH27]|uniref:helix-turn-helix transcriptional regulator n=1 Tax=Streptomyces sp. CoH27 TaxID=2875763 RepID=UPI001CD5725F|nr:LuxR family transcriptional regulator [Streptomyces sp. CoH27]
MFLGRDHEQQVIRELTGGLPARGGALVVIGDPGIGKSQLTELARQTAVQRDLMVINATGVPAESRLPYAGLHQLLRTLREGVDDLPGQQRDAVLAAFGQTTAQAPDRFLVALAVTELLTAAAARQPLVVLVDDAHWIDSPTCDVLSFLARRIDSEPIAMLATTRDGYPLPLLEAGLPELRLGGLTEEPAGRLLDAVAPGLPPATRRAILDTALGNPLALTELSQGAAQVELPLAGPGAVPITYRIERAFAARWSELPAETRTVLLVAALNEGGALSETLEAAGALEGMPVKAESVAPAIAARLVESHRTGLQFRHPLVRSAIEHRAGPSRLAAAHQALASVLADKPDRRAWHRAAAALGPDEDVAAELDEAAERAVQRAAVSVAITALERAVELSRDSAARIGRLLRAARLAYELGRPAMVNRFLMSVPRTALTPIDQARLALLEEGVETRLAEGGERIRFLVDLAGQTAADGQSECALDLLLAAARRCWQNHPDTDTRLLVAETALKLADHPLHPTLLSVLAFATPDAYGALARERLLRLAHDTTLDAARLADLGAAGTVIGVPRQARALLGAAIPQLRAQRRLGILILALIYNCYSGMYLCQWPEVLASADEAIQTAAEAARRRWVPVAMVPKAHVAAVHGDVAEMERLVAEAEPALLSLGANSALALLQIARGLAAIGQGDYHNAYEHLIRIHDPAGPSFSHILRLYHLGDLAEAAVRSGHRAEAQALFADLAGTVGDAPGPLLAGGIAYAAAILAQDGEEAERQFESALAGDLRESPLGHARLKLEYGSWLRRHQQPVRSREHLRAARDMLDAIGASAWRTRAEEELRASGARSPAVPAQPGRLDQLTPQEQRIARMVVSGLSNKEIGERLSVSHRTIGYHLYRMFPKLGITSRVELGMLFAESGALTETDPAS